MRSCLHLSPGPGWGLAPQLDQSRHVAARPLHDSILMAVALFLGLHPRPQSLFPKRKQHGVDATRRLCVSQLQALTEPHLLGSYLTGNGFSK